MQCYDGFDLVAHALLVQASSYGLPYRTQWRREDLPRGEEGIEPKCAVADIDARFWEQGLEPGNGSRKRLVVLLDYPCVVA